MYAKWPAMALKPWAKEHDLAMQARRAEYESKRLAEKQLRPGMENITASCKNATDAAVGGNEAQRGRTAMPLVFG